MAGDVAHPRKEIGVLCKGSEGNLGNLYLWATKVLFPPVLDKKESSLSWTPTTAFGELLRNWRVFLANYFTFSHVSLFFWVELIHCSKMADRLDCQCYCATWVQPFRAAPKESASGQAHTNTKDWATKGCQQRSRTTMVATRRECWIVAGRETDAQLKTPSCRNSTVI